VEHEADEETAMFSYSDRPVQEVLGLWREDRGNA
jgi:gentisate 1,2-dioxygenase